VGGTPAYRRAFARDDTPADADDFDNWVHGAATARLLCFSGAGFTSELAHEADRSGDARLLAPADLYADVLLPHT
jgi:hypothetical protein